MANQCRSRCWIRTETCARLQFGTDDFCSPHASGGASMGAIWPCHLISLRKGNHLTLRPAVNDRHVDTHLLLKAARKEVT